MAHAPLAGWQAFVGNVGVPFAVLLLVTTQLVPRIDRGIEIADQVRGQIAIGSAQHDRLMQACASSR